ncbi:transketolase family protein [Peptostreptococcus faecalis]|uniref:transketolase family protein n=1 Tax=Peptostreptococcus faecalis TaxID=2045015 RepID=UPI000C7BE511|nr:transketolase family protein [Peptostreptococcus faecalis]
MQKNSMRETFGKTLVEIGNNDENVIVVDADLSESTKTMYFKKTFPNRFFNVGIAEQNLIGISSGLASAGKTVFASSFAVFETGRAYEIIRNMVCMANLNVKICSTHAGIMTGEDGATHQSIEDISIMRVLPNMKVFVPADSKEASEIIKYISNDIGPSYVRMVREDVSDIYNEEYKFNFGKGDILNEGDDLSIFACGPLVYEALEASNILKEQGINARVINMSTIKPIDEELIINCAKETGKILTVEDHSIIGGLGSAISEVVSENYPVYVKRIGINDKFGMSGKADELYKYFGLTSENIVKEAIDILNKEWE